MKITRARFAIASVYLENGEQSHIWTIFENGTLIAAAPGSSPTYEQAEREMSEWWRSYRAGT